MSIQALSHGWKETFEERLARGFRSFIVDRKVVESETLTSFYLVPEDSTGLPDFEAGQFLAFEFNLPGRDEPLIRTYSVSEAANPDYYRVSISANPRPPISRGFRRDYRPTTSTTMSRSAPNCA